MILVLGGTHEGTELCQWLKEQTIPFRLSVATELGKNLYEQFGAACEVHRFTVASLETYIKKHAIQLLIDTTHPHAYEVKKVAQEAAKQSGIKYFRLERAMMVDGQLLDWQHKLGERLAIVETMEDAIQELLKVHQENNRYMITGTKYIGLFYDYFPKESCYFRVMPSLYSMKECTDYNVPIDHIIGIKAPCAPELNHAFFKAYDITHFIFKESGVGSATLSNLMSLIESNVKGMLISLADRGVHSGEIQGCSDKFLSVEALKKQ